MSDSALAQLQRDFSRYVLGSGATALHTEVTATDAANASTRLDVYAQAYRLRLLEVLHNDSPGLRQLAGDAGFEQLALAYIEATPSVHFNVRWYGQGLAAFAGASPWSAQPALAEMAALEWAMTLAFDAADDHVIVAAELGDVAPEDWPGMQFALHASLQRLALACNVNEIRRAIDREEDIPALRRFDAPQPWITWRKGHGVRHRCLEHDEAVALDALQRGASFADICELLCEWHEVDAVAMRAATLLQRWVEDQWISTLGAAPKNGASDEPAAPADGATNAPDTPIDAA